MAPTPYPTRLATQVVSLDEQTGRLVYQPYSNHINTEYGSFANDQPLNIVPDYSNVGYKGGGVPIPFVPTLYTVEHMEGDAQATIQAAIDQVSSQPIDATTGFRGAVLIKAGNYVVSSGLSVTASGVVIRGEGSELNGGTVITYTSTDRTSNLFTFGAASGGRSFTSDVSVSDAFVPVGAKTLTVADGTQFQQDDRVIIQLKPNQAWLDHMSDMSQYGWTTTGYDLEWRRTITAVIGNQITFDAPILQAIEAVYGGASVRKYTFDAEIENVGIENIRLESAYASDTDENHGKSAVLFQRVINGWMRQVTAKYFWFGAVSIVTNSMYITVEDSAMLDHKGTLSGGRRYSFNVDDSQFVLMQRCLAANGRHDFVSGSRTPGPNVWVDGSAILSNSDSGPHHRYATGQLYDQIKVKEANGVEGQLYVRNRGSSGSGHGWSGAQVMFWNSEAMIIASSPNGAMNYAVGNVGTYNPVDPDVQEPRGIIQSLGSHVTPRSLYYSQLKDRMGATAMNTQLLPAQKQGNIWSLLESWNGEGLFLDSVIVWYDESVVVNPGTLVSIGGTVRDLNLMEASPSFLWSVLSGPNGGIASFGDATSLNTAVSFSTSGIYKLELTVGDTAFATVDIPVEVDFS
mmetsp:Transcript_16744/g.30026  ORF Transcript_16744/g.30026 Transcript_16744/m.30026 type:complete len:629 (-) Transcript_16744:121-2007(-)